MMHPVIYVIFYGLIGIIFFYIGFIIGSIVDSIFFRIYKKIDPGQKNTGVIIGIVTIQIFVLIVIQVVVNRIPAPDGYHMTHSLFDLGYIISQFYMANFAMKKIANLIYDRENPTKSSLLEKIPGVGKFFERTYKERFDDKKE